MSIVRVKIKRYKSIQDCDVYIRKENLLVGENGSGKSNFISAIKYFYSNLLENNKSEYIFDDNNRYSNEVVISIYYDIREIYNVSKINRNKYASYHRKLNSIYKKSNNGILMVEMRQIKDMSIKWNLEYSERQVIKNIYDLYDLNPRKIEDDKWNLIWELLGDYFKGSEDVFKTLKEKINNNLGKELELKELNKKFESIRNIFMKEELKIKEWKNKEYFSELLKVLFLGNEFTKKNKTLDYFSEGTDLFNYYSLAISIINQISINKMKRPILLLDEPEANLHHKYIDKFVDMLNLMSGKVTFIISTHSSRLMKNAIRTNLINNTVHVSKNMAGYSCYKKINLSRNVDYRHKYHLSDEDANAYFSRYMILVEGQTELELFNNLVIKKIFSDIQDVDYYRVVSDEPREDIIIPDKTKANTLFYSVLDIDKVIEYEYGKSNFQLNMKLNKKDLFGKINKKSERYFINRKNSLEKYRDDIYFQYKKINNMIEERNINIQKMNDISFILECKKSEFIDYIFRGENALLIESSIIINNIRKYLNKYNIYFFDTTVEGAIINDNTMKYIYEYILYKQLYTTYNESDDINNFYYQLRPKINRYQEETLKIIYKYEPHIQIEILKILFEGKTSNLMNLENMNKHITKICECNFESNYSRSKIIKKYLEELKNDLKSLKNNIEHKNKTTWVSDFLMYYYFRKLYDNNLIYNDEIVGIYISMDIIFKYYNGEIKLTNNRLKYIKNNFNKAFEEFKCLEDKMKRSIIFQSSKAKHINVINEMKNDFPEINNLFDLLIK